MVIDDSNYTVIYRNPDGEYVHLFRAHYGSPAFKWFNSGWIVPIKKGKKKKRLVLRRKIVKLLARV